MQLFSTNSKHVILPLFFSTGFQTTCLVGSSELSLTEHSSLGCLCNPEYPNAQFSGPLLFLVYMNDLDSLPFSTGSNLQMFVDNILLHKQISSEADFFEFQKDVELIFTWTQINHLTLNPIRSKYMIISCCKQPLDCPTIYLNDACLEKVNHCKYLGI